MRSAIILLHCLLCECQLHLIENGGALLPAISRSIVWPMLKLIPLSLWSRSIFLSKQSNFIGWILCYFWNGCLTYFFLLFFRFQFEDLRYVWRLLWSWFILFIWESCFLLINIISSKLLIETLGIYYLPLLFLFLSFVC